MKKLLKYLLILGFVISSLSLANSNKTGIISITESNNKFCIDLYKALLEKEKGNIFISPYSISSALAMTYVGAEGNTKNQMTKVLHFVLNDEDLHSSFSKLNSIFNTPTDKYQLSIANSLWGQIGYPFREDFLKTIKQYYSAGFNLVDFVDEINREKAREEINKWVEDRTNQKIKELIHKEDLTSLTRLVLVNAIYFKGTWKYAFDKNKTQNMPFYVNGKKQNDIPMMHQSSEFNYYEDKELQALELVYSGDEFSMIVILPKSDDISLLEKNLTIEKLNNIITNLTKEKVEVYLPKFKIEKRYILNEPLIKLGMRDAFDDTLADFSKMTGNRDLYISKVIHQSFIEVNEEGTEAAASTAVIMSGKSLSLSPKIFKADHPFIFFILYKPTNTILFMGRLIEP